MNKQTSTPTKGTDNNKRLAALEAGVSALAITLTANDGTLGAEFDPIAVAIERVKHAAYQDARVTALIGAVTGVVGRFAPDMELAPKDAGEALIDVQIRLLEQLVGAETPCDRKIHELEQQIAAGPTNATEGEIAAIARAEKAEGELASALEEIKELTADVEDLASEKNRLTNELTGASEGRPPAAPEVTADVEAEETVPAAAERIRPETARDVGPTAGGLNSAELGELLTTGDATGLELVFSNGEFEIVALQPIKIGPNELQNAEGRQLVVPPVYARLLNTDPQEELAGVGLLMQGEQIAYCSFPDRLTLQPGHERRFDRAIFF